MSERTTEQQELQTLLEGKTLIYYAIHGMLKHQQTENKMKPFSGHFEFDVAKQTLAGALIDPVVNKGLVARIKGVMDDDSLEFFSSDEIVPGNFASYQFRKVGELWTKDGTICVWRGICKFNDEIGDAACKTSVIIPKTIFFNGEYNSLKHG